MNVALVELSESHEECIFSQVSFLVDSGYSVSLFINPKIKIENYKHLFKTVDIYDFDSVPKLKQYQLQFKILKRLKTFDKVIFNTASSSKNIRNIALLMTFYKTECIGIIHNIKKLNNSFTQKIISLKVKKYLALSDSLVENISLKNKSISLSSFYPIFFHDKSEKKILKPNGDIWICIPGRVQMERRNYSFLLQFIKNHSIPKNIKFIILGNINTISGLDFKTEVNKHSLEHNFIFFDTFITNNVYYSFLKKSDYIMPLLQKNNKAYITSKISGAFNLAFAFKKHLLTHEFYKEIPDLCNNSVFYNDTNFNHILTAISQGNEEKIKGYNNEKWSYNYQKEKYITFINK